MQIYKKQTAAVPDHLGLWGQQSAENLSSPVEQFRAKDIKKKKSTSPLGILRKDSSKIFKNVHPRLKPLHQAKAGHSKPESQRGHL